MTTAVHSGPVEVLPPGAPRDQWLAARRQGIGASEIAAVLGISPWESPFGLYWRKANGWEIDASDEMAAGTLLEPAIADWWADKRPFIVERAGLYANAERPWQLATPDRLVWSIANLSSDFASDLAVLECKYVAHSWHGWGEPGTDEIPVYYRTQVLQQVDVMGVDGWHLAALGPGGFRAYQGRRDEKDLAVMRHAGAGFMRRLAEGDPPDVDEHTATLATLKKLHPSVDDYDVQVDLNTAEGYRRARAMKIRAEKLVDRYEARLRAAIGTGRRAMCNRRLVASRTVFDRKPYTVGPTTVDRLTPGRSDSYDD
jgi:putative phage-type endonuclease